MNPYEVVTEIASKLLFELVPKLLALRIDPRERFFVLRIGSSPFHPDSHDCSCKGSTKRTFAPNPSTKPAGQPWDEGVLISEIILETQGNRFGSVEPLIEITLCFFCHQFRLILLCHAPFPNPFSHSYVETSLANLPFSKQKSHLFD